MKFIYAKIFCIYDLYYLIKRLKIRQRKKYSFSFTIFVKNINSNFTGQFDLKATQAVSLIETNLII